MRLPLFLRATRPGFLSATVIACLLGFASAYHEVHTLLPGVAVVSLLCALLGHSAANVYNDVADAALGSDAINTDRVEPFTGGSRLIQNGELTLRNARLLALLLMLGASLGGIWLVLRCGPGLLAFGAAGLALGFGYSSPRVALMSRGLGEASIATTWWLIVVGSDYTQRGVLASTPMLVGMSYAALLAAILLANSIPDRVADAAVGKRTLVVRLGPTRGIIGFSMLMLFAHAWVLLAAWAHAIPAACAWAGLTAPLAVWACIGLWQSQGKSETLRPSLVLTQLTALGHGLLLALALCVAR